LTGLLSMLGCAPPRSKVAGHEYIVEPHTCLDGLVHVAAGSTPGRASICSHCTRQQSVCVQQRSAATNDSVVSNSSALPVLPQVSDGVYIVTGPLWLPQRDGRGTGKWEMRHPMIGAVLPILRSLHL
jgi:hypothetical protein